MRKGEKGNGGLRGQVMVGLRKKRVLRRQLGREGF
jgi:hypothetical protein